MFQTLLGREEICVSLRQINQANRRPQQGSLGYFQIGNHGLGLGVPQSNEAKGMRNTVRSHKASRARLSQVCSSLMATREDVEDMGEG